MDRLSFRNHSVLRIAGAGGLAREVFSEISNSTNNSFDDIYFHSDSVNDFEKFPELLPRWAGGSESMCNFIGDSVYLVAIGNARIRGRILKELDSKKLEIFTLLSLENYYSETMEVGEGSIILPNVSVSVNTLIGKGVLINPGTTIAHDVFIENYVSIGPGVNICGNVKIGEFTNIGAGSVILPGMTIGKFSQIAAGAVVTMNVDDNETVAGVPARKLTNKHE